MSSGKTHTDAVTQQLLEHLFTFLEPNGHPEPFSELEVCLQLLNVSSLSKQTREYSGADTTVQELQAGPEEGRNEMSDEMSDEMLEAERVKQRERSEKAERAIQRIGCTHIRQAHWDRFITLIYNKIRGLPTPARIGLFENNTFKFLPTELLENQSGPPAPLLPARQWAMVTHIYRFTAIGNVYNKAKFELVIDSPLNSEDELKKLMNEQIDGALKDQLLLMDLHGKFIGYMADPTVELTPLQVSYPVGNEPPDVTPETMWTVRDMRKYPAFI